MTGSVSSILLAGVGWGVGLENLGSFSLHSVSVLLAL
jgi:hypothetical protein